MGIVYEGPGDLFAGEVKTLTCTVNTVGVMGKGIALAFRTRYPAVYQRYRRVCLAGGFTTGQLLKINDVLCFPTKQHWRDGSKLEWIEAGLAKLVAVETKLALGSLGMVPLGCSNGGLDYVRQVRPLMLEYLNQLQCPVYLYTGQK